MGQAVTRTPERRLCTLHRPFNRKKYSRRDHLNLQQKEDHPMLEEVSEAKSAQVIPSAVAIPVPIMKQEFVIARFRKEFHGEALRAFEGAMER